MLIDKDRIVDHLNRIHVNGQIPEVVVKNAFSASAISASQQLIVVAAGLDKVEPLSNEEIGIVDLPLFIRSLRSLSGEGGQLGIQYADKRLRAEQRHGGRMSFATASPSTISTRLEDGTAEKALAGTTGGVAVPLEKNVVDGVFETTKLLKAEEIQINVKRGGGNIFVGAEVSHNATFDVEKMQPREGESDYTLYADAAVFTDVLQQISDYTQAQIILNGPQQLFAIKEGLYTYIISPKAPHS